MINSPLDKPSDKQTDPLPPAHASASAVSPVTPVATWPLATPRWAGLRKIAFIGSHIPRRCGIATFGHDLATALCDVHPDLRTPAVALNDPGHAQGHPQAYAYPDQVTYTINQATLQHYRSAAEHLNQSGVDAVSVQHEFGLFGGDAGEHLLTLLERLTMPVVTTLHTVLREPNDDQLRVTRALADHSDKLIVMAERAVEFLTEVHDISIDKIERIPHGIPEVSFVDPAFYKDRFNAEGRDVILTFGLIGPSKGLDLMIDAMPAVVKAHPQAVYFVLGATHPGILAHEGEAYRQRLLKKVRDLGLDDHVRFINQYVDLPELKRYLGAADLYVTPYLNEAQITSGTLSYAVGCGKYTISTPYWHAQELLADGRGCLVPMNDADALSQAINHALSNPTHRHAVRKKAFQHMRPMRWPKVAEKYLDVFADTLHTRATQPQTTPRRHTVSDHPPTTHHTTRTAAPFTAPVVDLLDSPPRVDLSHLSRFVDATGVLSAAIGDVPDLNAGYDVSLAAMTLATVMRAQDHLQPAQLSQADRIIRTCLALLAAARQTESTPPPTDALQPDDPSSPPFTGFYDRLTFARQWEPGRPQDAPLTLARVAWAASHVIQRPASQGHLHAAVAIYQHAVPMLPQLARWIDPLPAAFALLAVDRVIQRQAGDQTAIRTRDTLAQALLSRFHANASDAWPWLTDTVDAESARIAHALIVTGQATDDQALYRTGQAALHWLMQKQTHDASGPRSAPTHKNDPRDATHEASQDAWFSPVGGSNALWRGPENHSDKSPANRADCPSFPTARQLAPRFPQSPRDVAATAIACLDAHRLSPTDKSLVTPDLQHQPWLAHARLALAWFTGGNDLHQPLINGHHPAACHAQLTPNGIAPDLCPAAAVAWLDALAHLHDQLADATLTPRVTAHLPSRGPSQLASHLPARLSPPPAAQRA